MQILLTIFIGIAAIGGILVWEFLALQLGIAISLSLFHDYQKFPINKQILAAWFVGNTVMVFLTIVLYGIGNTIIQKVG